MAKSYPISTRLTITQLAKIIDTMHQLNMPAQSISQTIRDALYHFVTTTSQITSPTQQALNKATEWTIKKAISQSSEWQTPQIPQQTPQQSPIELAISTLPLNFQPAAKNLWSFISNNVRTIPEILNDPDNDEVTELSKFILATIITTASLQEHAEYFPLCNKIITNYNPT